MKENCDRNKEKRRGRSQEKEREKRSGEGFKESTVLASNVFTLFFFPSIFLKDSSVGLIFSINNGLNGFYFPVLSVLCFSRPRL